MNGHSNDLMDSSLPKGVPFDDYQPPNWDEFFMLKVYLTGKIKININRRKTLFLDTFLAKKSKDPRTKIGAVLVRDRRDLVSGYNGLPEGD
jgi:deoxycytidylate deaminase